MDGEPSGPQTFPVPPEVLAEYELDEAHVDLLSGGRVNRTMRVRQGRSRTSPGPGSLPEGHDLVIQHMLGSAHNDLLGIMENLVRVTAHLDWKRSIDNGGDSWYPVLVPTSAGKPFIMTPAGDVWRAFLYRDGQVLRGAQPIEILTSAARIYGRFTAETHDLGGPPLIETAPGFHDLDVVHGALMSDFEHAADDHRHALQADVDHLQELQVAIQNRCRADGVHYAPRRVVHNDTKLSNVLFAMEGERANGVLDLDLVMMGPTWHDVGDLIRSSCWHAPASSNAPTFSIELFDQVLGAFVDGAGDTLTDEEIVTYAMAGPRLSFELGLRYLNDHLRAEPHLAVAGENGHLNRGRGNVFLAEEMLNAYDALRLVVDRCIGQR